MEGDAKTPKKYLCTFCHFSSSSKQDFERHLSTRKHKMETNGDVMEIKNPDKNNIEYVCEKCKFITSNKKDYERHLSTRKHETGVKGTKTPEKNPKNPNEKPGELNKYQCSCCEKIYSSNSNLWKHKKKCPPNQNGISNTIIEPPPDINATMFIELLKDHKELRNTLIETTKNNAITTTTTTTNSNNNNTQFNLQVFLNETCKDAMNLTDFINSLQVTMEDFETTGRLGYVEGITRIILNGLKQVDTTKRPIHCTDVKRETLYVKTQDAWEKENLEKEKLKTAVKQVARMNLSQLPKWQKENPASEVLDTREHGQYMKFAKAALGGMGDMEETRFMDKIMKKFRGTYGSPGRPLPSR